MHRLIIISGIASIGWGALMLGAARGGIHEVYGAIMITGGLIAASIGALMVQIMPVTRIAERLEDQHRRSLDAQTGQDEK